MSVIWITEVPVFQIDGDAVKVTLLSDGDPIVIRLSRHHCRVGADTLLRILDRAELGQHKRLVRQRERGKH